jgi:hypothetical protein
MKDEPRKFHICRYILCRLIVLIYVLYLCYLVYSLVTDEPTLKVEQIFLNEIDVPGKIILNIIQIKLLNLS